MASRQQLRRDAYFLAYQLLKNYLDVGQPHEDCISGGRVDGLRHLKRVGDNCPDCDRTVEEIKKLMEDFVRKGWIERRDPRFSEIRGTPTKE